MIIGGIYKMNQIVVWGLKNSSISEIFKDFLLEENSFHKTEVAIVSMIVVPMINLFKKIKMEREKRKNSFQKTATSGK